MTTLIGSIQALDLQILWRIGTWHHPALTVIMRLFTTLGDLGLIWIILGGILLLHRGTRRHGAAVLAALVVAAVLVNLGIKPFVLRPRPPVFAPELFTALISLPHGSSFPSAHACTAFACAAALFTYDKRTGLLAAIPAALISFSRIYLWVHFPSDVLAGAALGCIIGVLTALLVRYLLNTLHYARLRR